MEAIPLILQLLMALADAEPTIEAGVVKAKALIDALFTAKIIDATVQDALHATIDARAKLAEAGLPPVHWTVEPDPQSK